ncbi:alpha/beta hydrolase [Planomonospora sp. ID67723]|uniref:alpha/beta hydrolase n=1 Tax=Planomonospora sp. ID67723 TaxID=2738134 RepID=UPI0018C3849D|nr:alpha/beta hydrolase [Planomonospora sp. ID67723]MBG0832366.1 alpha/beta hydrolase [Planomonospora sp. ID67723]
MSFAPSFPVMLRTADNVRIDAAHTPSRGAADLGIVLAHGFTGSLRERPTRRITHVLSEFGGVVSLDFRGHGRSGGESTVGDLEILDLDAAVRHARVIGYSRIVTVGFSMGGAVVLRHAGVAGAASRSRAGEARGERDRGQGAASRSRAGEARGERDRGLDRELAGVDAVVSVSAPARWYYRGTRPMRQVHWAIERPVGRLAARLGKRTRIARGAWDPVPLAPYEAAAEIAPTPLLVVHGDADTFFPLDHAHQIHDAARSPKELWIEPGYGHAESAATPELVRRIGRWTGMV